MHLVVDENIAFAREVFSLFGEVTLLHGRKITREALKTADALIVRSITQVNEQLLHGTPVRFVGTATIGTDHIDIPYLKQQGITFADAKGCNADAVTEYILTATYHFLEQAQVTPEQLRFGIIGCGNIGGRLANILPALGFTVLKNDPPLQRKGQPGFSPLADILQCDIITCHTPLNKGGEDNSFHLIGERELQSAANLKLLLNASRGEVVSGTALLAAKAAHPLFTVLDVWENEPYINPDVLTLTEIASPHIAGYTYEGKINGTTMMYDAVVKHLQIGGMPKGTDVISKYIEAAANPDIYIPSGESTGQTLNRIFSTIYQITNDTKLLKNAVTLLPQERGSYFDALRKDYTLRREFTNYTIHLPEPNPQLERALKVLRFGVA